MSKSSFAPSIFESFNARPLQPSEVARRFVPSDAFEQLARRRHTLIIGPRGSGKTTLLKMLQLPALETWHHPRAEEFASRIEFTGVFIPFDRSWRAQIDALGGSRAPHQNMALLGEAAFTAHVFRALTTAFLHRTSQSETLRKISRVALKPQEHSQLAKMLYASWSLPEGPQSLLGVRAALGVRLSRIGILGHQLRLSREPIDVAVLLSREPELLATAVDGLSAALDAWEAVLNREPERWGLLFDELELAPASTKQTLFGSLRSRDPRLLFKLALSPFDGEMPLSEQPVDPQAGHDFDRIELWHSEKRQPLAFCRELWLAMLAEKGFAPTQPRVSFGRSQFETVSEDWTGSHHLNAYAPGTRLERSFTALEEVDPTFRRYLASRGLDSRQLDRLPPEGRAAEVRKIAPLVTARLFFLRPGSTRTEPGVRRSRKRLTLYAGWESLCAVSEGNPRWFIGMVNELLEQAGGDKPRVPAQLQAQAIEDAADRFRAALRTIPVSSSIARTKRGGLMTLLDSIGEYFRYEQIEAPFSPEPPGSFMVDEQTPDSLIEALGQALNAGALVIVEDADPSRGLRGLRGLRLRLCYLLVASYGAMPRLARPVSLQRILTSSGFESRDPVQLTLT